MSTIQQKPAQKPKFTDRIAEWFGRAERSPVPPVTGDFVPVSHDATIPKPSVMPQATPGQYQQPEVQPREKGYKKMLRKIFGKDKQQQELPPMRGVRNDVVQPTMSAQGQQNVSQESIPRTGHEQLSQSSHIPGEGTNI